MSITKSYNKYNDTYYVYDTQYVWSEEKQRKVARRTCIGKWDKESNQVIPTGSEGRLHRDSYIKASDNVGTSRSEIDSKPTSEDVSTMFSTVASNLKEINSLLSELATNFEAIGNHLSKDAQDTLPGGRQ